MAFGTSITVDQPFDEALAATREVLARQGFGVITEIDMQATMKNKLGEEYAPFVILGACNPNFAHQALGVDPSVATLLPCNVVVREEGGAVEISTLDPQLLVQATGTDELAPLAGQLTDLLAAAFADLAT
ncbi:MAG: DUF302 domain-containing protein [Candidatus Nanopelagicales bacterium]